VGAKTAIGWTGSTVPATYGCDLESPGCTHCYAMAQAHRLGGALSLPQYEGLTKWVKGRVVWNGVIRVADDATLLQPLRWRRPRMIFVDSMADLFHPKVPQAAQDRAFAMMALAPRHTFQVVTKRHEIMRDYANDASTPGRVWAQATDILKTHPQYAPEGDLAGWPLRNVWKIVSVEDQVRANLRVPVLLDTLAHVRGLSVEPMLSEVDISLWLWGYPDGQDCGSCPRDEDCDCGFRTRKALGLPSLDWVICGGESGHGARPMHPDWAFELQYQCDGADVPFFFKQWGEFFPAELLSADDIAARGLDPRAPWRTSPDGLPDWEIDEYGKADLPRVVFRKVGKKAAGDLLRGSAHDWLLQYAPGDFGLVEDAKFRRLYRPA